jgi:hypothetical protein
VRERDVGLHVGPFDKLRGQAELRISELLQNRVGDQDWAIEELRNRLMIIVGTHRGTARDLLNQVIGYLDALQSAS